jgi:hypothetical protein
MKDDGKAGGVYSPGLQNIISCCFLVGFFFLYGSGNKINPRPLVLTAKGSATWDRDTATTMVQDED